MSRAGYFWLTYMALCFIGITSVFHPSAHFIWNASPSVPTGLYTLTKIDPLKPGELVAVKPPKALSRYMAERFYLPLGLPLIKHIGALPGQTVCRRGSIVSIDGHDVATAQNHDHAGRPLPVWQGCHLVGRDEILLLNDVPDSFDGRYFGILPIDSILGRTEPLWTSIDERAP